MTAELSESEMRKISEYFCLPSGEEPRLALWVIGRPAAGKTTTANLLCEKLGRLGRRVELVDGEAMREIFDARLGYSKGDRLVALRRLIHVNRFLQARGVIPVTATIAGLREFRELVRQKIDNVQFIFLDCPLEVAVQRDPKGLYAKARRGEVKEFYGVDVEFEVPAECALKMDSSRLSPPVIVARILRYLARSDLLSARRNGDRSSILGT